MTTPEQGSLDPTALALPPLPSLPSRSFADHERYIIQLRDVMRARDRILLARIAELESLWQSAEARYAEADAAAMAHAKRIAELEADAARYRWLRTATYLDGETLAVFVIDEASEIANKGEWLSDEELDAAIDAAREAKP